MGTVPVQGQRDMLLGVAQIKALRKQLQLLGQPKGTLILRHAGSLFKINGHWLCFEACWFYRNFAITKLDP